MSSVFTGNSNLVGKSNTDDTVWGVSDKSYAPTPEGYPAVKNLPAQKYLKQAGTIDLSRRQMIDFQEDPKNPDPGSYGSEYSARERLPNGDWISFPTIYDGKAHSRKEAFDYAVKTGKHLGIYDKNIPNDVIDQVETALHARPITVNGKPLNGDLWMALKGRKQ